jgi:HSP90 family molecular chaperone
MDDNHYDKIKNGTVKELIDEFRDVCYFDSFTFLKMIQEFEERIKEEVIEESNNMKKLKVKCPCGVRHTLRHQRRHNKSKHHMDYVNGL